MALSSLSKQRQTLAEITDRMKAVHNLEVAVVSRTDPLEADIAVLCDINQVLSPSMSGKDALLPIMRMWLQVRYTTSLGLLIVGFSDP